MGGWERIGVSDRSASWRYHTEYGDIDIYQDEDNAWLMKCPGLVNYPRINVGASCFDEGLSSEGTGLPSPQALIRAVPALLNVNVIDLVIVDITYNCNILSIGFQVLKGSQQKGGGIPPTSELMGFLPRRLSAGTFGAAKDAAIKHVKLEAVAKAVELLGLMSELDDY